MRSLVLCSILLCGALMLSAQTPDWEWAVRAGGSGYDQGLAIAADGQGNQYVTGTYEGTANFGPFTLVCTGAADVFVAKLDSAGNWLWAVRAGGYGYVLGLDIDLDSAGNIYLSGNFNGDAVFGTHTLSSLGGYDIFAAKLDGAGNWLWSVRGGGPGQDWGCGIAVDGAGNVYLGGYFYLSGDFGQDQLTANGFNDVFTAKLDTTGNWLWAVAAGGESDDYACGISVDGSGNAYLTGYFWSWIAFGPYTFTSEAYTDIFAAKLDTSGNWLWARQGGGMNYEEGHNIAADATGNSIFTGFYEVDFAFGTWHPVAFGNDDVFAIKVDPAGNLLWGARAGGLDSDYAYGIDLDNMGNVYLAGNFWGSANFGSHTITGSGADNVFAAKLDSAGNWLWAAFAGGNSYDLGRGIAVDGAGNACLTGFFSQNTAFGPHTLTSSGSYDIFIAKLGSGTPVEDALISSTASLALSARPNPFNPETTISYTIPNAESVSLDIYNSRGQLVRGLLNEEQPAGEHSLVWNGKDDSGHSVASGLYLCRIACKGKQETRKMLLMK